MPDRKSNEDVNEIAARIARRVSGEDEGPKKEGDSDYMNEEELRREAAKILGRLGGLKGGPARAKKLSKKRRQDIARKAAQARWSSEKEKGGDND